MTLLYRIIIAWRYATAGWHPFASMQAWRNQTLFQPSTPDLSLFKLHEDKAAKKLILKQSPREAPE